MGGIPAYTLKYCHPPNSWKTPLRSKTVPRIPAFGCLQDSRLGALGFEVFGVLGFWGAQGLGLKLKRIAGLRSMRKNSEGRGKITTRHVVTQHEGISDHALAYHIPCRELPGAAWRFGVDQIV